MNEDISKCNDSGVLADLRGYGRCNANGDTGRVSSTYSCILKFFEELICRGFLLAALAAALGFWPAAILSSIAFGAVHTQFPFAIQVLVGVAGFAWCLVAARAKSLLAPYISHMTLDWLIDPFL